MQRSSRLLFTRTPTLFKKSFKPNFKSYSNQWRYYKKSAKQVSGSGFSIAQGAGIIMLGGGVFYAMNQWNNPQTASADSALRSIPDGVRQYLVGTYQYLTLGMGITALSGMLAFRSGLAHSIGSMGWIGSIAMFVASIGLLYGTIAVDPRNTVLKHGMFTGFTGLMGASISTLGFLGGPVLFKAAIYTFGIFLAMSMVALNAKEEKFLYMGGALSACLMVLVLSSFAGIFLPASFARTHSVIHNLWLYGGLALFTAYLLYDTQKVLRHGRNYLAAKEQALEKHALMGMSGTVAIPPPDYVAESLHLYLDLLNIFIRLAIIFSGNKKK